MQPQRVASARQCRDAILVCMTTDNARAVIADPRAPLDERYDAEAELTKSVMPTSLSDLLLPRDDIKPVIDHILADLEEQAFAKAQRGGQVIPFPKDDQRRQADGMQSMYLDDLQINVSGDWYEKPGMFSFDSMRQMVSQTPILEAVIITRINQVKRFCRAQENGVGPGFEIRLRDKEANATASDKDRIKALQGFFSNCGFESNPRKRGKLKRDDFSTFMAKLTRDSLTMDSAPIETEFKKDKSLGMDGIYAVDGATIRLCTEEGYQGDDEIRALQVVQGRPRTLYTYDNLIYKPRNPRTDVLVGGYGMSECEVLIRTVTYLLNAMTYNGKYFDSNSIPKGVLHMSGQYSADDLAAFKRYLKSMTNGVQNAWAMPVLVSKDQESKASFENFGVEHDEMAFAKWMTFLTSIICAIFGIGPDEINFESFSSRNAGLGNGNDTEDKLANSKDKGLHPLLSYFEDEFTDYIVSDFSDDLVFRFTGLTEEDEDKKFERQKLVMTVNEMRALDSLDEVKDEWGNAPINPSLLGAWQAEQQAGQEDYGTPGADGEAQPADAQPQDFGDGGGQDFGDNPTGAVAANPNSDPGASGDDDMAKAYGLPVFQIEV